MMSSPFLPEAPIYEDAITSDNKMTDIWKNHLDSISQTLGLVVTHDRFDNTKQETPVFSVIGMTTAQRNQLQNAFNGVIIYNTTTNAFNFRQGGAWVTFTPVPA
jgi:hypothetical protein